MLSCWSKMSHVCFAGINFVRCVRLPGSSFGFSANGTVPFSPLLFLYIHACIPLASLEKSDISRKLSTHHVAATSLHAMSCSLMVSMSMICWQKMCFGLLSADIASASASRQHQKGALDERNIYVADETLWCPRRLVNIHVINTLGVAPEDVPRCIECWCSDERHAMKGKHGGGSCCSESLCPSSVPSTAINTYHLQFSISYR